MVNNPTAGLIELSPVTYDAVRLNMLQRQLGRPALLNEQNIEAFDSSKRSSLDQSFVGIMNQILREPEPVDTFALTATSAIPVADALRGLYDGLGLPRPHMTYIETPDKLYYQLQYNLERALPQEDDIPQNVLEGLRVRTQHAKRICIVEQYVHSGFGIKLAAHYLRTIGHTGIVAAGGNWFDSFQSAHNNVDLAELTSPYAVFMYDVGQKASRLVA